MFLQESGFGGLGSMRTCWAPFCFWEGGGWCVYVCVCVCVFFAVVVVLCCFVCCCLFVVALDLLLFLFFVFVVFVDCLLLMVCCCYCFRYCCLGVVLVVVAHRALLLIWVVLVLFSFFVFGFPQNLRKPIFLALSEMFSPFSLPNPSIENLFGYNLSCPSPYFQFCFYFSLFFLYLISPSFVLPIPFIFLVFLSLFGVHFFLMCVFSSGFACCCWFEDKRSYELQHKFLLSFLSPSFHEC